MDLFPICEIWTPGGCAHKSLDSVVHHFEHKVALPATFEHGKQLSLNCWEERFTAVAGVTYFLGCR